MTLNFDAKITINANDKTSAIHDSLNIDNKFYPENPVKTSIKLNKKTIIINVNTKQISQLRANLNSTLRLIQVCNDSIEFTK